MKSRIVRLLDEEEIVLLSRIQDEADATAMAHGPSAASVAIGSSS
jgi:hypothetical protein